MSASYLFEKAPPSQGIIFPVNENRGRVTTTIQYIDLFIIILQTIVIDSDTVVASPGDVSHIGKLHFCVLVFKNFGIEKG